MISDFCFAISAQRRKMQKRRYFWFSFVELEWKLQLWFSTADIVYFLFFIYAFDFAKWKSENRFNFLIFDSKWWMKIGKLNLFSNFRFQIENENWKSLSDFRFPFSNQKRKSELWNSTRTEITRWFPFFIFSLKMKIRKHVQFSDFHLSFGIENQKIERIFLFSFCKV